MPQHTEISSTVRLPEAVQDIIQNRQGSECLEALARLSFNSQHIDTYFPHLQSIIADTATRWTNYAAGGTIKEQITCISCLARILPFARYLQPLINRFLGQCTWLSEATLSTKLKDVDIEVLRELLLSLFRLLSQDLKCFTTFVKPVFLCSLLACDRRDVQFLVVECFSMVMRFADDLNQTLITKHIGDEPVLAIWENTQIDYRMFKLYEEKRWQDIAVIVARQIQDPRFERLKASAISTTVMIGDVLLPKVADSPPVHSRFVHFRSSTINLNKIAQLLQHDRPILVTGSAGSGKTAVIREVARLAGARARMVTLHLNDQTDAKSLLGIYTSSTSGAGFIWQSGVLTKAVQEGRWILIEDIDKAPAEVMGVLRPLLENNELFLSSRKERIRPRDGFRVFATMKTNESGKLTNTRNTSSLNDRLWQIASITACDEEETQILLLARFPSLKPIVPMLMAAHIELVNNQVTNINLRSTSSRNVSIRDLLKWARRVVQYFSTDLDTSGVKNVKSGTIIDILKDGVDCYCGHVNDQSLLELLVGSIAKSLNIAPEVAQHAIREASPMIKEQTDFVQIGRSHIRRLHTKRRGGQKGTTFARTRAVRCNMEAIASAAQHQEPQLLVGETGVGKTTILQHVAELSGQSLTVVNLSNQSESSDLLGGLKPVTTRSLLIPLVDQFNDLFDETFSANKNAEFRDSVNKSFTRQRWQRLLGHWQEAIHLSSKLLKVKMTPHTADTLNTKRRKLDLPKWEALSIRWNRFNEALEKVRSQIQHTETNQVFAFVESRLVEAVRNGGWLLLDEINLASSETLDSIISLFQSGDDESSHLLLVESGNVERIEAHPNFRIFAAMNPATDTGKKDLPSAIRIYFTELYVHTGDDDVTDLVEIIQTYLGQILDNDTRVAVDLAKTYLALKQLNARRSLTDGAGDLPHYSLRSLTRCLQFVRHHVGGYGLRRATYDGIQMSFFTVLDQKSQKIALAAVNENFLYSQQARKAVQNRLLRNSTEKSNSIQFEEYILARGPRPTEIESKYIITPSVRQNMINVVRATTMRRFPVLLQGPTSAGKTSMIEYLAKYSGNKFVRINNHEHTDLQEYLGSYSSGSDGRLEYREGVLVEALRQGHWLVLDELNLAPSDVLEALNRLLDDNRELLIPETQEILRPHQNFMLFATQNPAGLYGGRKRLSRAFRNRFLEIHVDDIPENELETILMNRSQIPPSRCQDIVTIYKSLSLQRQSTRVFEARSSFATLRDLFRWASRKPSDRNDLARHGYMLLAERVRDPLEKATVRETIEKALNVKIDLDELYGMHNIPEALKINSGITWTGAMRRLFCLVAMALQHNEPVLLVGSTGCGKTQVCQSIAQAFGRELDIYNAHSNTETGDLIGSQRPVRQKTELAETVMDSIASIGEEYHALRKKDNMSIDDVIKEFKTMDKTNFDSAAVNQANQAIAAFQSLFAWNDGSLVRAMKDGHHFLLDEISLADDSVLERLNSVLEPTRAMLLAEKGAEDNFVVAQPHFQFLATMNPGGDYGKRELSAALRNRLTEIWVPALTDNNDIMPILQAQLPTTHKDMASTMISFARYFHREVRGEEDGTITLRPLLNWARFILDKCTALPVDRLLLHGAAMTYIDSIGANPASISGRSLTIEAARNNCLQHLHQSFGINASSIYFDTPSLVLTNDEVRVGDFSLNRTSRATNDKSLVMDTAATLQNTMRLARALQTNRPILMEGNPGVGKTAIVSAFAELCGRPLTRINLSDQTDLMDLFGTDTPAENEQIGKFVWRDGPLLQAMQAGHWILLDEMNLATQSVLEGLNACLDHRKEVYIAELDKTFSCHPEFMLFATQNPHDQGGGRKGLPASFVNRFTVVFAEPFSEADLLHICRLKYPGVGAEDSEKLVRLLSLCQQLLSIHEFSSGAPWELNLRDLNRWLVLCQRKGLSTIRELFQIVIVPRFRDENARQLMKQACVDVLGPVESSLYNNLDQKYLQVGVAVLPRNLVNQDTSSSFGISVQHLAPAQAMLTAIDANWPIVLSGPGGSGKTALIRSIAAQCGARLVEFSMSADVDTTDLVGGYEQNDHKRTLTAIRQDIASQMLHLASTRLATTHSQIDQFNTLWHAHQKLTSPSSELVSVAQELRSNVSMLREAEVDDLVRQLDLLHALEAKESNAFVWNEGILIDAMTSGSWFVLDNANLSNASVLDRLNSLMEPDGYLNLNEQHSADSTQRVVRPHPNFRIILTMDPRYGELSRAMRNRSLEIALNIVEHSKRSAILPKYISNSRSFRLRRLMGDDQVSQDHTTAPIIDQLSQEDLDIVLSQPQFDPILLEMVRVRQSLLSNRLYARDGDFNPAQADLALVSQSKSLPVLLHINEPYMRLNHRPEDFSMRSEEVNGFFTLVAAIECVGLVDAVRQGKGQKDGQSMLEKSLPGAARPGKSRSNLFPAYSLLHAFSQDLTELVALMRFSDIRTPCLRLAGRGLNLFINVWNAFCTSKIDQSYLQSYLEIVQEFITEVQLSTSISFDATITVLGSIKGMSTGRGLRFLWQTWCSQPYTSKTQLDSQLEMERIIEEFDELCQSLPQARSELAVVRQRLLEAAETLPFRHDAQNQISILRRAIGDLEQQRLVQVVSHGPLAVFFQTLVEKGSITYRSVANIDQQKFVILGNTGCAATAAFDARHLSRLPVVGNMCVSRAVYGDISSEQVILPSQISELKLQRALQVLMLQPMHNINRVQEELQTLLETLAGQCDVIVADELPVIVEHVNALSNSLATSGALSPNSSHAKICPGVSGAAGPTLVTDLDELLTKAQKADDAELVQCILGLQSARTTLSTPTLVNVGRSLLTVGMIALRLFIPEQIFDPSLRPSVEQQIHRSWVDRIREQISAWQEYNQSSIGSGISFVVRVLQAELSNIGKPVETPKTFRPETSQLAAIQVEFSNVLRSVVSTELVNETIVGSNDISVKAGVQLLNRIRICFQRLVNLDRAYGDLINPVMALLSCVAFATRLVICGINQPSQRPDQLHTIVQRSLGEIQSDYGGAIVECPDTEKILSELAQLLLRHACIENDTMSANQIHIQMVEKIDQLYLSWKQQLSKDQIEATEQSKYFTYRGEDLTSQVDLDELNEMFPSLEVDDLETEESSSTRPVESGTRIKAPTSFDGQAVAHQLAEIHRKLSAPKSLSTADIILASIRRQDQVVDRALTMSTMPEYLLSMQEQLKYLSAPSTEIFDIYTTNGPHEVRQLHSLIVQIQTRFKTISDQWPDHVVPHEVLSYATSVLAMPINDPLIKLMTKTEKLIEIVSQWQSVASREYSVSDLLDSITNLIIRWRRMELASWSKLLDKEDDKMQTNVDSWYFVAYEAIIHNALSYMNQAGLDSGEDEKRYLRELARTLEEFFTASSLGQFKHRLQLIGNFGNTLKTIAKFFAGKSRDLTPFYAVVANSIVHYQRYEKRIIESLSEGRKALEKQLIEQIKLASWKDTNLTALRESARRSHFKLFGIVKKYRTLLGRPVTNLKSDFDSNVEYTIHALEQVKAQHIELSIERCGSVLTAWDSRPDRFKNPYAAIKTMRHAYGSNPRVLIAASEVSQYTTELADRIAELRQATPSTLTEENAPTVRELKQQKRLLLSDTFKTIAGMGIQRNMGSSALEEQSSTARVMIKIQPFSLTQAHVADMALHELLDLMPQARSAAIQHSEELTDGETQRGLGYAEGFLRLLLKQRNHLSRLEVSARKFDITVDQLRALEALTTTNIDGLTVNRNKVDFSLNQRLTWLRVILGIFEQVLTIQLEEGGLALQSIISSVQVFTAKVNSFLSQLNGFANLPPHITCPDQVACTMAVLNMFTALSTDIRSWVLDFPQVEHLTSTILLLTTVEGNLAAQTNGFTYQDIHEVDKLAQNTISKTFLCLQNVLDVLKDLSQSSEDPKWLVATTETYGKCVAAFSIEAVLKDVDSLMGKCSNVQAGDTTVALSLLLLITPVICQFAEIMKTFESQFLSLHYETCRLAVFLTKTYTSLAKDGFCTPQDGSNESKDDGKVEEGTGLGEGEAAADISNQVGDDEDLTDLAQEKQESNEKDDMEKSKDAINMDDEELEGEMGSGDDQESADEANDQDDNSEQDVDEEMGSVDNLDPDAVDEKMWDDMQNKAEEEEKEMQGQQAEGKPSQDQAAGEQNKENIEATEDAEEGNEDTAEEEDAQQKAEGENIDQHVQEEQALDMPEDLQLNGEEDKFSDTDMDDLSDIEKDDVQDDDRDLPDGEETVPEATEPEVAEMDDESIGEAGEQDDADNNETDKDIVPDQNDIEQDKNSGEPQGQDSGSHGAVQAQDDSMEEQSAEQEEAGEGDSSVEQQKGRLKDAQQDSVEADDEKQEQGTGRNDETQSNIDTALKSLADVLEEYHQRRDIQSANTEQEQIADNKDIDMADADFEHVDNPDDGTTQAMGTTEQDAALDIDEDRAVADRQADDNAHALEEVEREDLQEETLAQKMERLQHQERTEGDSKRQLEAHTSDKKRDARQDHAEEAETMDVDFDEELDADNFDAEAVIPPDQFGAHVTDLTTAQQMWSLTSNKTQSLSLMLTEQLRLILQPTTATKLRGDFRTGKRLNIRRIIPYIASGYKRDKIWMRRSVPSKRNYQVMLAVDDSRSMAESGADIVALETLCMLSRSLSMLEVGDLSIVAFGKSYAAENDRAIRIAHPFTSPFSPSSSGPEVFTNFTFRQTGTNVHALLAESIQMFKDARLRSTAKEAAELWQLQIIISDGLIGSDPDNSMRRLLRRAREERIMPVFVVIDDSAESIVDLKEIKFEADPNDLNGPQIPKSRRYLETFPFQYYVIVRDTQELPRVLARVLKSWFESVVESG